MLLEQPPLNQAQRALAKSKRVLPFCNGLTALSQLREPSPDDLNAMIDYATAYWGTASAMKLVVELPEDRQGRRRRIELPNEVTDAVLEEQAQMWAFAARLWVVRSWQSEPTKALELVKDPQQRREIAAMLKQSARSQLDTAFMQLVNSSFTKDEWILSAAGVKYCL